jgi:predicted ATPase
LFSVLYGSCAASYIKFDRDAFRELAARVLSLAERQGAIFPLMIGHRVMAASLAPAGDIAESRAHYDQALALYDPGEQLAMQFGQDHRVAVLSFRSWLLWLLGYPEAALADASHALKDAREIGQAGTLMFALSFTSLTNIFCGHYASVNAQCDEVMPLADEKGALLWKAFGMLTRGCILALTGKASDAVQTIIAGITAWQSTGASIHMPVWLSYLARANAEAGQFDDAWRRISEAITAVETTGERIFEAEVNRMAGEIALKSPQPDAAKAEAYFDRALAIARAQQAKSWELRAAMSMARRWRDRGKRDEARELLAPVYGWFTEGFDTLDLKQAKALLDALAS